MYFETVRGQSPSGLPPTRPSMDIRILVVDDDATTLTIVSSILQLLHYKVETAKNPLEALATLRMHKGFFDLVVTDLHMPYMNGFELQKLVEEEFQLPVIIMSADDTESVLFESATRGIVLFLPKPVSANDLRDLWMYTPRAKKGKSVVIKEITEPEPNPNPNADAAPPLCIDLCDDDDNGGDNNNPDDDQGPPPSLSGPRSSSFAGNGVSSLAGAGGALVLRNQFGKRGERSPAKDGKKKASKTSKRSCRRTESRPPGSPGSCPKTRKPKIVWTNWLHNRFLLAIRHLNLDKAFPKRILEFMNVPGLTRENVASHLQKYRLFLKKIAENGLASTKMLGDKLSSIRSSFAIGYPIQMMLENAQQLYPQLAGSSQPLMLTAPPQQHESQSASLAPNYNSNNVPFSGNHSVPQITGPVGVPTLLTNNQPAANVVQQPPMLAAPNFNGTNTNATTSGNVGSAASGGPNNPYAHMNYGGNNSFAGSVNPMPVWQQQNQARVVPFAGTNYPSNNNFGVTGSAISGNWNPNVGSASSGYITNMSANNSAGFHIMNGGSQMNMAGHINQSPAGGDVPNIRINGCGGRLGMLNGANLNGNVNVVRPMQENWGNGGAFGYGNQVGGRSSFSGFPGADSPLPAAQAPQVLPSINYQQQQNANVMALPQPPQPRPPQAQIPEIGRRERENNNNKAETELGDVVDNNDIILPPVDLRALLDDFPSDFSDISFEEEREVSPHTNQVAPQNPDPLAAGPFGVQENHCVLGTEQAPPNPGGSVFPATSENYIPHPEIPNHEQARFEDLIDPFQFMNIESLNGPEVDWDKFFDAVLEDDFGKGEWSWE